MKVVLGLLVLVGLGWVGIYFFGGYGSFDATAQGKDIKSKISPGMSHAQVFAVTDNPRKYRIINRHVSREKGGVEVESFRPSNEVTFDRARVDQHVKDGTLPHGFCCTFRYSNSEAFTVLFDGTGTVKRVDDAMTLADLLDLREHQSGQLQPDEPEPGAPSADEDEAEIHDEDETEPDEGPD